MSVDSEKGRFDFLIQRDGLKVAIEFIERAREIYVQHSIEVGPHFESIKEIDKILKQQEEP